MGSSSLTRDRIQAPCTESAESWPLDHQGSLWSLCVCVCVSILDPQLVRSKDVEPPDTEGPVLEKSAH